jgi:hypothetical protein
MRWMQNVFTNRMKSRALMAVAMGLLIGGCSSPSNPPPPAPPPPTAEQAAAPPPILSADQMAKLCQEAPDTCHRVQAGQPLTLADVKVMAKLSFSPDVIINLVRNSRTVYHLGARDIIDLKNAGVSDQVIDFLINTPSLIAGATPVPEPSASSSASQTPPPEPIAETPPPSPGTDYTWVEGDWVWNNGWVWVGGHWVIPPYRGAIWLHGRWGRGWGGYHRGPGRWH